MGYYEEMELMSVLDRFEYLDIDILELERMLDDDAWEVEQNERNNIDW